MGFFSNVLLINALLFFNCILKHEGNNNVETRGIAMYKVRLILNVLNIIKIF